ncbi:hypothetical protein [Acinetobacter rudis]|uniref:Uncharacterized protein n=1 Tax=Acinetobacter rudis TaxID=632955 RepID=A0AAW8JAL3_9GAMM|nr:hypothetical protein [Acinetobacter rudis]MDQ8937246.1 hypothetical protein [Acinetobacter rudis]MDQ8952422.1 hypothetical protein [Acinetobacter rudis]MDQ9019446.1 hypothetical protein [Acinetobacter rudis]
MDWVNREFGGRSTEKISKPIVEQINNQDLLRKAFDANKKLNSYFQQVSKELKLLPEDNNPEVKKMTRICYFYHINELIYENSKLLGFDYPLYSHHISFAINTKQKVYAPVMKHMRTLV